MARAAHLSRPHAKRARLAKRRDHAGDGCPICGDPLYVHRVAFKWAAAAADLYTPETEDECAGCYDCSGRAALEDDETAD